MDWDYKDIYAYSVMRIKENINFNYCLKERYPDQKEFYDGVIFGLYECLDMMRSDIIILDDESTLKEMGLDFEPLEKYESGTMFEGLDDYKDYDFDSLDDEDDLDDEENN